jgi:hypothetical protein
MSLSTFMSPKQPGVPSRVCHLVGPISGGRFYVPLFRARATHHITSHQNIRPRGVRSQEERRRRITRSCEYKVQETVWPRYLCNQLHASAGTLSLQIKSNQKCQVPACAEKPPAMPDTASPSQVSGGEFKYQESRGNQATDESEKRCLTSGWTQFGNTIMQFLYKRQCDCLKVL